MQDHQVRTVNVFPGGAGGGNPAPIVLEADGMGAEAMREVARQAGHESGFVLAPDPASGAQFRMRYFVPLHEMEMCGHATVGALWLLRRAGRWTTPSTLVETASGLVHGYVRNLDTANEYVEISQPEGKLQVIDDPARIAEIAEVLRVSRDALLPLPILNAVTSRVKTLVGIRSVEALDALQPDFPRIEALCAAIGSTGLYPFAVESAGRRVFHARQFPKSSGYPEDAATGIAAAALLFGLKEYKLVPHDAEVVTIHQGRSMGKPSEIWVRFNFDTEGQPGGCLLGGRVADAAH